MTPNAEPMQSKRLPRKGGWRLLFAEVCRRFFGAWGNPVFFGYFFGIVVLVAGVGIWITWVRYLLTTYKDPVAESLAIRGILESAATYAVAISSTALADIMLAIQRPGADSSPVQPIPRSLVMLCFILTVIVICCLVGAFFFPLYNPAMFVAAISMIVGLIQWWIINAENPSLADDDDPSQLLGDDPLQPLGGNLKGFTVN